MKKLCCNEVHDLSQIIASQTELQILGIYEFDNNEDGFLATLQRFQNAQLHLPVVITFGYIYDFYPDFDRITIFPSFYSIDRNPTIQQVLAESFDKYQSSYMSVDAREVSALTIYLVDSCDLPSIHVFTEHITMKSPLIAELNFCFKNQCEIVSFLLTIKRNA